jgi:toxin ParE1/3/4
MARYRLSGPAKADIAEALRTSEIRHGGDARIRYRGVLAAALRRITADPQGRSRSARAELLAGLRSFRIRHRWNDSLEAPVGSPVHVIFRRVVPTPFFLSLRDRPRFCGLATAGWRRSRSRRCGVLRTRVRGTAGDVGAGAPSARDIGVSVRFVSRDRGQTACWPRSPRATPSRRPSCRSQGWTRRDAGAPWR